MPKPFCVPLDDVISKIDVLVIIYRMEEVSLTAAATIVILFVGMANLLGRMYLVKKSDKQ